MKGYVKGKPFVQNGLGAHLCQLAPYEMVICTAGLKAMHFVQAIPRGIDMVIWAHSKRLVHLVHVVHMFHIVSGCVELHP